MPELLKFQTKGNIMALKQELTIDATGAVYPEAYFRIMRIDIDTPLALEATTIQLHISAFVNNDARVAAKNEIWTQSFQFSARELNFSGFDSPDSIKATLYALLKTTDYFANASDV